MCYRGSHHWKGSGHHHGFKHFGKRFHAHRFRGGWNYPPVNVEEFNDKYEVYVYASGFSKKDFVVAVKDNVLVISAEKAATEQEGQNWKRQEFVTDHFKRRFELDEKVDKEKITAQYQDGVLQITLPKLEGFESVSYDISVD